MNRDLLKIQLIVIFRYNLMNLTKINLSQQRIFSTEIVEKHAPVTKKFIKGDHTPFMNKKLGKTIYSRSRLHNKFYESPSKENKVLYKKQRNKCALLRRKSINKYFNNITKYGLATKIPPKLVKLAAGFLAAPLSKTMNNSISEGAFPNEAKIALVFPIDKTTPDQISVLSYKLVSILPTLSKIFGKVIKNYLMKSMNNYFCLISQHTQHELLRLTEEWKTNLVNNFAVGALLINFSKAFDCIPYDLLNAKLASYGFKEKALLYIYLYL